MWTSQVYGHHDKMARTKTHRTSQNTEYTKTQQTLRNNYFFVFFGFFCCLMSVASLYTPCFVMFCVLTCPHCLQHFFFEHLFHLYSSSFLGFSSQYTIKSISNVISTYMDNTICNMYYRHLHVLHMYTAQSNIITQLLIQIH